MRRFKKVLTTAWVCFLFINVNAQDSITVSDAIEMRVRSESLVKRELKELLDNISTNESTQLTKEVITGSHSGSGNKIFYNSKVVIEDDINPAYKTTATSHEIPIDRYLSDFDLFYKKSEVPSIFFNDFRTSNVKKGKDIYVKVYFTSLFKNANKYSDTAYTQNNRQAEIRFLRDNKKWVPYISSISFFNPADTANDLSNDILLVREKNKFDNAALSASAALSAQLTIDGELKAKKEKEMLEAFELQEKTFTSLMREGDNALEQNDFVTALKDYKQAQDLKPYDMGPRAKLDKTRRKQESAALTKSELFDQYVKEARTLARKRHFKEALESYQQAAEQKPDLPAEITSEINALTKTYRVLSTLEEKYNAGLYKEAIRQYRDANKKDGENSDYYLGIARCYVKMNEPKDALKNYDKAYELDKNNLEAIEERAILYKKQADYVNALTDYKSYVLLAKDNTKIYEEMADLKILMNNKTDEAVKFLDDGIRYNPKSASLYIKKGLLLLQKNDFKEAEKNFTSAIRIDSSIGSAFFNRGKCQYGLKRYANAATDFESARTAGLETNYLTEIAGFAEVLYAKSTEKFNQKAIDSALFYVSSAISITPSNSTYWFNRGEYLFAANKMEQAITNYDRAIQLTPAYTTSYYKRGLSYYNLKKYHPAIADLRSADSLNSSMYLVPKSLGDAYYAIADFPGASVYYENSLKTIDAGKAQVLPATIAEIYNLLGETYYKAANYEKALNSFKSALKKNGNFPLAYYNRGIAYYKTNELSNAVEDISKAISSEATNPEWFYSLANVYQEKKEYQKAAENYSHCIKLDTARKKADAVYYRGVCYYQVQNWNDALKDYEVYRSRGIDSGVKEFDLQLGNIYLNTGKKDSAYSCFNRFYTADTTNGLAMYNMARVLYFTGKTDEALALFDRSFQTKMVTKSDIKKESLVFTITSVLFIRINPIILKH
ncbi:MAG: tetratricopeptide repeat protein [Bacteroidota bacterium]